ncbi:MAG: hypothetical protein JO153_03940, partial [Solirubrobacterales bacterium]|nr:hypothetical protein [Solirubrobacterales bacterium]
MSTFNFRDREQEGEQASEPAADAPTSDAGEPTLAPAPHADEPTLAPAPHADEPLHPHGEVPDPLAAADEEAATRESPGDEVRTREQAAGASRVSVVDEQPPRPAPPAGASEEEYRWHTYRV